MLFCFEAEQHMLPCRCPTSYSTMEKNHIFSQHSQPHPATFKLFWLHHQSHPPRAPLLTSPHPSLDGGGPPMKRTCACKLVDNFFFEIFSWTSVMTAHNRHHQERSAGRSREGRGEVTVTKMKNDFENQKYFFLNQNYSPSKNIIVF